MNEYEVFESLASPSVLTEEAPLSAAEMALVAELMRKAIEHVKNVPAAE